jgi:hypothetical protein
MSDERKDFTQGVDYYLEDGRIHFTKEYLEKRGTCCGNNCRHCPYDESIKGNKSLKSSE